MWSRTFALLVRALRLDARQVSSHLARMSLLVFVVCLLVFGQLMSAMWGAPGLWFFKFLSWVNYFFATLAAALLFATAITEEKEEQTLGLLRMANVGAGPLLLGKGVPRLLSALLILTAQFPFTLLAITLGGVSWTQVHATYWALFAHIVLIGGIGLFFSVVCRRSFAAAGLTLLVSLAMLIGAPALYGLVNLAVTSGQPAELVAFAKFLLPFSEKLYETTASARLIEALSTGFDQGPFGLQVLSNLGIALGLFGLSWLCFEPFNRNLEQAARSTRASAARLGRHRPRCRRAWATPLIWKDFYYLAGGPAGWVARSFVYGLFSFLFIWFVGLMSGMRYDSMNDLQHIGDILLGLTLFLFLPLEGVVLAARIYRSELRDRTWSTLMQLPRSLPEVVYPKLVGCLLGLAPAVLYLGLGAVLAPRTLDNFVRDALGNVTGFLGVVCFLSHALLFMHLTALFAIVTNAWLGALLAMATSFVIVCGQYAVFIVPLLFFAWRAGGPGFDEETYFAVMLGLSDVVLLAASVMAHLLIGQRLKQEAAG
jgi:ABC-type transport system involved in multi-copper enzyme maturation permease subunit